MVMFRHDRRIQLVWVGFASTNAFVDVHELSITNDIYVGLDRTDAGRSGMPRRKAGAVISSASRHPASYAWTECGIGAFDGPTDGVSVGYQASNAGRASANHLAERLTVAAMAEEPEYSLSASANCTTNFTVVAVNVEIGGIGEDKEESEGAFVPYVADATNGAISVEETNKMAAVKFFCSPRLPKNEMVTVFCIGPAELYECQTNGTLVRIASADFPACEVANHVLSCTGIRSQ